MPTLIDKPTRIQAAGTKPKTIEPGQTPQFDEYSLVLKGILRVTHRNGSLDVRAGQAVIVHRGE